MNKLGVRYAAIRIIALIGTLLVNLLATTSYANVRLVLDARNVPELPRNFRIANDLHIAGGGQYSELGLQKILDRIGTKELTVIDLRQESHGFLNGNAVSWYGRQDAANAGKTPHQIEADQRGRLASLGKKQKVSVELLLKKSAEGAIDAVKSIEFTVHSVMSEAELTAKYHLHYHRLYVQDFHAPSAYEVDRFINIVKRLPTSHRIYFHCRAGVGRTTTFMVMFDMMRNAKKDSFDAILQRQRALGGKDLRVLPVSKTSFKYGPADTRIEFLRKFYEYARGNDDEFETLYSASLREGL